MEKQSVSAEYQFKINVPNPARYDPANAAVEVEVTLKNGQRYRADFITRSFIDYVFEKNNRTGECAQGTYFCMTNPIIVTKIDQDNVKNTIDSLICDSEFEMYFQEL